MNTFLLSVILVEVGTEQKPVKIEPPARGASGSRSWFRTHLACKPHEEFFDGIMAARTAEAHGMADGHSSGNASLQHLFMVIDDN